MRGAPISYSAAEMAWLEANRMMVISDYHAAFQARFGRADVAAGHLHALRKRKGWKVGRARGRYKGRRLRYSDAEIAWLRENCTLPIVEYHRAFQDQFDRPDVSAAKLHGLRKREGFRTGRTGQFEKGAASPNKGRKMPFNANSARYQFKRGHVPHTYKGAGHERVDATTGYVIVIVDEPNPWTGAKTRPVQKHILLWTQVHGPVPDGHVLKCLDGDRTNTDPGNWECVPQGLLPRLNGKSGRGYDAAPAELKPTIMAVAKLEHALRRKRDREAP